ncbi:DUF5753 domain-containing protein [Micromonospora sp. NPDC000089]|uniref:DUF5753 domain-containing protein n=1 Tax=unclassified Micromonospora TaxID=2617518 RepID=UPI0036C7B41B
MNHCLIAAMTEAGETADSLAGQIGVDPKTAQRWVNPGRVPQPRHRSQVAAILQRDVKDLWPDILKRREPAWFRQWADIEREAVALRAFQLAWVPGLLQTDAYARATLANEALTSHEVEELVAGRLERQALLHRERPPLLVAVIDESVLRRTADGNSGLMREQCAHLLACADLPSVQIHIVPATTGIYSGLGGPFTIAELSGGGRVAHVDSQVQAQILDQATDVATLDLRWERIRGEALPRANSLDLLREATQSWA